MDGMEIDRVLFKSMRIACIFPHVEFSRVCRVVLNKIHGTNIVVQITKMSCDLGSCKIITKIPTYLVKNM